MNLDAYMDDFGRDLTRAARTRRRRRTGKRLALALPVAVAATVAAFVIPGPNGGTVDAVAAARAALAPDGEIVHMKIELQAGPRIVFPVEQWYAADPVRWRTRTEGFKAVQGMETLFRNGRVRFYDARRDVVTIWRPDSYPGAGGPSLFGGDPATDLRAELGKGGVRDDGLVTHDGREVRRLVRTERQDGFTRRFVYYVDPGTFEPVGGHLSIQRAGGKTFRGPEFTVTLYERLPFDERLLEFKKTPDTKYVWR
ncbi:hypothetical protein OJ998_02830 [Solirubrobacter taibaiensis]|nr:hypothetical protein [Solirubrobacter taibaiensis]